MAEKVVKDLNSAGIFRYGDVTWNGYTKYISDFNSLTAFQMVSYLRLEACICHFLSFWTFINPNAKDFALALQGIREEHESIQSILSSNIDKILSGEGYLEAALAISYENYYHTALKHLVIMATKHEDNIRRTQSPVCLHALLHAAYVIDFEDAYHRFKAQPLGIEFHPTEEDLQMINDQFEIACGRKKWSLLCSRHDLWILLEGNYHQNRLN